MELLLSIVSIAIGVGGLAYAIQQGIERRSIQDYIRSQNWHSYAKANNAAGSIQSALRKYKETGQNNIDALMIEELAKADAFGQDVFKDVIRQIQVSEPAFDEKTIDTWMENGRISEKHSPLFKNIAPTTIDKKKRKKHA